MSAPAGPPADAVRGDAAPPGASTVDEVQATVGQVLRSAAEVLSSAGIESARADAELLLAHVTGISRGELQVRAVTGAAVPAAVRRAFADLIRRRQARQPLQHLTGRAPFRTLELAVGPGVFVPRPETEVVAQHAIDALRRIGGGRRLSAVDLGTGSGAIALAIAVEVPGADVVGVESSTAAHTWAVRNARAPGPGLATVRMVHADLAGALPTMDGAVDVVVSNPPYVPDGMVPRDPEVRLHDPAAALYGGADGLDVMRSVIATAHRLLRPGGTLVVEHGEAQGGPVRALLGAAPVVDALPAATAPIEGVPTEREQWIAPTTHPDLTGRDRVTTAIRR